MVVMAIMNSGASKEPEAMHLRCCLAFLEVKWEIQLWAENVMGKANEIADAISRNRFDTVFSLHPQMRRVADQVAEGVLQAVARDPQTVK